MHSVLEVPAGSCFVLLANFLEGAVLEGCLQCLEGLGILEGLQCFGGAWHLEEVLAVVWRVWHFGGRSWSVLEVGGHLQCF